MISHGNCEELNCNLDAVRENYLCISMRGKVEHAADRLRWRHTNWSDSNEIICIMSTDNYTLVTKIHEGNEHNYAADTMGQWTYCTICTVVCKSLLVDFMCLWEQNEAFPLLCAIKFGETDIWRNWTRNGPSVVIHFRVFLGFFFTVLLGDFEWGV